MKRFLMFRPVLVLSLVVLAQAAKTIDPYKVLGVERNASQREIQKAFHKLSLQYHPDKNKNKGAQEKFAEINNAYDILSDEEKRKNYDLYGDEKGGPGFDAGYSGHPGGRTHFTSGGQGQNGFNFRPGGWQDMGGQGSSQSFSFSFGGPSSQNSFGFGLDDIFSNFFGGDVSGSRFGGFGGSTRSQFGSQSSSRSSPKSIKPVNSQVFKKEIAEQGMTWLLLSHTPSSRGIQQLESIIQEVADSLQGALKVGSINCKIETSLCEELGIHPLRQGPTVFVYSYKSNHKGSLVEYNGNIMARDLKAFCQDHLPRFSTRIELKRIDSFTGSGEKLPRVLLLSTKKDTPVIWRVLSGLYHKRFTLYDAQVLDVNDPTTKKLGVDAIPAIVGWLSNGEKHVLKSGISVKDLKTAIHDLSIVLDGFEKKNKKAESSQSRKSQAASDEKEGAPLLAGSNFDSVCGESPVCVIGAFRSSKAREKLESILTMVSQKSLSRRRNASSGFRDSVSYCLLDVTRQREFLHAFDKSGFKQSDSLLLAYKPRKGKFATFKGDMTTEEAERFISSVLNGDVQFSKIREKPVLK